MPRDVITIASDIDRRLREAGTPERAAGEKRYLKSDLEFYGVTVPALTTVVKAVHREHPDLSAGEVTALAAELWAPRVHERRAAAIDVLSRHVDVLRPSDVDLVERFLRESMTWALVDHLATRVAGGLVTRFGLGEVLDRWAADDDFWIRRSALLTLLVPLREGGGDFARFARYADAMLDEKEFFIRKAIGWVLRDTGRKRPQLVYDWIAPRTHRASGVTMREVVKPLPEEQREELMAAYKAKVPAAKDT